MGTGGDRLFQYQQGGDVELRGGERTASASRFLPVPSDKLDEDTAAAISAMSQAPGARFRIKMHNKLAALVILGTYLGNVRRAPAEQ
jgi:hypothetical protein